MPLSRHCQFYTRYKYPGPRESFLSPGGFEARFPWLPWLFGSELGGARTQERELRVESGFRFPPWAVCHTHRLQGLLTAMPGAQPGPPPPALLRPLANARPPPLLSFSLPPSPRQLSLRLQEKYSDIACASCHEIHTGRGKRMKAGSIGAPATSEHFVRAARAWGCGLRARRARLAQGAPRRRSAAGCSRDWRSCRICRIRVPALHLQQTSSRKAEPALAPLRPSISCVLPRGVSSVPPPLQHGGSQTYRLSPQKRKPSRAQAGTAGRMTGPAGSQGPIWRHFHRNHGRKETRAAVKEQSGLSLPREERSVPFPKTPLSLDPYVPPGCLLPTPLAAQTPPRRVLPDHLPRASEAHTSTLSPQELLEVH